MNEETLVPKLRFSGFDDEWEQVKLKDIATFSKGKGISKNDITEEGIECIRYGELYTKYGEIINDIHSKTDLNKNDLVFSSKNDILIPCSGETAIDLATASCVPKEQIAIGGDITIIQTDQYAPFVTYYLNQKKTEIAKFAQGVSIVHLYPKDFKELKMKIPSIPEQKKIISLLNTITQKEELLEKKYKYYQNFKKYLMQQIFAQKLRFNYEDEWEFKKLGEVSVVKDGTHDSPKYIENGYPLITSKNLVGNELDFENVNYISKEDYDNINKRSNVDKGDILFGMIGTIGNPIIVESDDFAIKNVALIKEKTELMNDFLIYVLDTDLIRKQFYRLNAGGTQKFIALGLIKQLSVPVPSIKEQKEISDFLSLVDMNLTNCKKQLFEINTFKKGLLQQMFV